MRQFFFRAALCMLARYKIVVCLCVYVCVCCHVRYCIKTDEPTITQRTPHDNWLGTRVYCCQSYEILMGSYPMGTPNTRRSSVNSNDVVCSCVALHGQGVQKSDEKVFKQWVPPPIAVICCLIRAAIPLHFVSLYNLLLFLSGLLGGNTHMPDRLLARNCHTIQSLV